MSEIIGQIELENRCDRIMRGLDEGAVTSSLAMERPWGSFGLFAASVSSTVE